MMTSTGSAIRKKEDLITPLIAAFLIVQFFFFIDEGYYDFRWMKDFRNWIVFVPYLAVFFLMQWVIYRFLLGRLQERNKRWVMLGAVMPITIILFLWLVF